MQRVISLRDLFRPLALALLAALIGAGCQTHPNGPEAHTFRVMTYNIHHGEGLDGKIDLMRISELITSEGADVVALQEVDRGVARTARRDFPAELAALTGMKCVFNNNYDYQNGEYGNAVLSRFPVTSWTNIHYQMLRAGEQRGVLRLVLEVRGREVVFMNTHLDHRADDAERWINLAEIETLAKQGGKLPTILCGDFNDTPESRVCKRVAQTFDDTWKRSGQGNGFTIPAANPAKRIDYIWISKDGSLAPLKAWVPLSEASDHLPVVADFQLR